MDSNRARGLPACVSATLLLLATTCSTGVHAQSVPFRVELPALQSDASAPLAAEAGKGVTLVLRITNTAATPQTALTHLQVPEGWQSLFASDSLMLAAGASTVETVTVTPARDTAAGTYTVRYEVRLSPTDLPVTVSARVQVAERHQLTLSWPEPPVYVGAGSPIVLDLLVSNRGNVTEDLVLNIKSRLGVSLTPSTIRESLAPGEQRRLRVARPAATIAQATREILTASAARPGQSPIAEAAASFQVVPVGRTTGLPRVTVPASASLRAGTQGAPGFGSLVGGGPLSTDRATTVRFGVLEREQSSPLLLEPDRTYFNLNAPRFNIALGDQTWSLSPLTEAGHYGVGVGARVERAHWLGGAFLDTGRRDVVEGSQVGAFLGLTTGPFATLTAQYLRRYADTPGSAPLADIGSLRLVLKPTSFASGSVEVGTGQSAAGTGRVAAGQIAINTRRLTATARTVRRDDAYPIRDKTGLLDSATVAIRPFGQLQLRGTLDGITQIDDRRLPLDAPTRQRATRASVAWGSLARVGVARTEWASPARGWDGSWLRESATAELRLPLGRRTWLSPGAERGEQSTPLTSRYDYSLGWLSAGTRIGRSNSLNARAEIGRGIAGRPGETITRLSIGASLRPRRSTGLTLQVQNSATDTLWVLGSRTVNATLEQDLPWKHRLLFRYQSRAGGGSTLADEHVYRVDYVVPFGVPLWTATDGGRVTVRLRDAESGRAQPSTLLQLDNQARLTDERGVVTFTGVRPGEHLVTVEAASIGAGRTVVPNLPLTVAVANGAHVEVSAAIVRTAGIRGRVLRFVSPGGGLDPGLSGADALVPGSGVIGALVDLVVGGEHRTAVTDAQGRFVFGDVPPGSWPLRLVRADIGAFYRIESAETLVALAPGAVEDVTLRVVPKAGADINTIDIVPLSVDSRAARPSPPTPVRTPAPAVARPTPVPAPTRLATTSHAIFSMPRIGARKATRAAGKPSRRIRKTPARRTTRAAATRQARQRK